MLKIGLFWFLVGMCEGVGQIASSGLRLVKHSLSNSGQTADYVLSFTLSKPLAADGSVSVLFPRQFGSVSPTGCSVSCSASELEVILQFGTALASGVSYSASIYGVSNPSDPTGTANFGIRAYQGKNLLAESLAKGGLGFSDSIRSLISTGVALGGEAKAGELGSFLFSFKTPVELPAKITLRLGLPTETFVLSAVPTCFAFAINGVTVKGSLVCSAVSGQDGAYIDVQGFSEPVTSGGSVGVSVAMRCPAPSQTTGEFYIAVYAKDTANVIAWKTGISGLPISAGSIEQVIASALDPLVILSQGKLVWILLSFRPRNALSEGSRIEVRLPSSMSVFTSPPTVLGVPWSYYVFSGLEDGISGPLQVALSLGPSGQILTIQSFAALGSPGTVSLAMLVTLPSSAGVSAAMEIATMTSSGAVIDSNLVSATLSLIDVDPPTGFSLSASYSVADGVSSISLTFVVTPAVPLPVGSSFEVLVDARLAPGPLNNCLLSVSGSPDVSLPNCSRKDRLVTVVFPAQLNLGVAASILLSSVIVAPSAAGQFFFDAGFRDQLGVLKHSRGALLVLTAQPLSSPTIQLYPAEAGQLSVLSASFTLPSALEASTTTTTVMEAKSFLELEFSGAAVTLPDLGMGLLTQGSIPCRAIAGLLPASGNSLSCILIPGTSPIVRVTNFQASAAGEAVALLLPNVRNPSGTWTLTLRLIRSQNRLLTLLAQTSQSVVTSSALAVGISTIITTPSSVFYAASPLLVDTRFQVSFRITDNTPVIPNEKIIIQLPKYDSGFVLTEDFITCSIMNMYFRCYSFPGLDWIFLETDTASFTPLASSLLVLNGLHWPRYVPSSYPASYNTWRFIDGTTSSTIRIMNYPPMPLPDSIPFISAKLRLDKKRAGEVDCTYEFFFKIETTIPENSSLVVTFPTSFNLLGPYPAVVVTSPELLAFSSQVQFSVNTNTLTVSSFPLYYPEKEFSVVLSGVRNPLVSTPLTGFSAVISKNGNLVAQTTNFISFSFIDTFSPAIIKITDCSFFPTNVGLSSTFSISFKILSKLSPGSLISIQLPSVITSNILASSFACYVDGAITTYESCLKTQTSIDILLNSEYQNGEILFIFDGIRNPSAETTISVEVSITYDSTLFATSVKPASFTFTSTPLDLRVTVFSFWPQNEGEKATYTFGFQPTMNIDSSQSIALGFSEYFDRSLGSEILFRVISGLTGNIVMTISERYIYISNFNTYSINDGLISFQLDGIVNPEMPSFGEAGFISTGILSSSKNTYSEFTATGGTVIITSAPVPLRINELYASNYYCRIKATYSISFTIDPDLLSQLKGVFTLPSQFEKISYGTSFDCVQCLDTLTTCKETLTLTCSGYNWVITTSSLQYSLSGYYAIRINGISNPQDEGNSSDFVVSILNPVTNSLAYRTYWNLNALWFGYTFPGPLIVVNNNLPIYVEVGAQSLDLLVAFSEICALNITISVQNPLLSIYPSNIEFHTGDLYKFVRVSAPSQASEGEYELIFTIEGDSIGLYTPIRKSTVIVTARAGIPLRISSISDVPIGGSSLAVMIETDYAPDVGFEVSCQFAVTYSDVQLNTTVVAFTRGMTVNYFEVRFIDENAMTSSIQSGQVTFSLQGVNKDSYTLNVNSLSFNVIQRITSTPEILEIDLTFVNKTSSSVYLSVSDICTVYFVRSLQLSPTPSLLEASTQGPPAYQTFESVYGIVNLATSLTTVITFSDLIADTPYVLFVYLVNRNGIFVELPTQIEFVTSPRDRAAIVQLGFVQSYINAAEKTSIFAEMAFLMSLLPYKITENLYPFTTTLVANANSRIFPSTDSTLGVQIQASPDSAIYPKPTTLALTLKKKLSQMKAEFPNFDIATGIKISEFVSYTPDFSVNPSVADISYNSVTISCQLGNFGTVYAVFIKKTEDLGKPQPFQIRKQLTSQNYPVIASSVIVSAKFTAFNLFVTGLDPSTSYTAYLTCASAEPGQGDLASDESTIALVFETSTEPVKPWLDIDGVDLLSIISVLAFLVFI